MSEIGIAVTAIVLLGMSGVASYAVLRRSTPAETWQGVVRGKKSLPVDDEEESEALYLLIIAQVNRGTVERQVGKAFYERVQVGDTVAKEVPGGDVKIIQG